MVSGVQIFRQDSGDGLCLLHCLGLELEEVKDVIWNHLKAYLLTCLVTDPGGRLESSFLLHVAFSLWPGLPTMWMLGSGVRAREKPCYL